MKILNEIEIENASKDELKEAYASLSLNYTLERSSFTQVVLCVKDLIENQDDNIRDKCRRFYEMGSFLTSYLYTLKDE